MRRSLIFRIAGALMLGMVVCAAADQSGADPVATTAPAGQGEGLPPEGEALISFMRPPSPSEGLVKYAESVWEIVDDKAVFVGLLKPKQRVNYIVHPGTHLFMAVGETAEYMTADVASGRTYYAALTGKMGTWRVRFWLRPVHQSELSSKEFTDALGVCTVVDRQPRDDAWAEANIKTVEARRAASFAEWQRRAESDRLGLRPPDGR